MKRRLVTVAGLAAAALTLTLAGCAPSASSEPADGGDGEVTLNVWSWRPEDKTAYTKIFSEYEKQHPGVTVKFSAFKNTEYPQVLTTGLTGSSGPDIAQVQAYGKLQPYVEGGNLLALDGKVAGLKDIDEAALAGATGRADGKVYGVPFAMQTLQMFYNKDIFAKYKLSVPKTWDDFVAVNATLTKNGITPMAVGGKDAWTLPILHDTLASAVYGGSDFQKKVVAGTTTFEDPAYVKSLQTVVSVQSDLPKDVVGVSYTDAQSLFLAGQAGMYPGGSFELGFFTAQNPNLKLGVFAVPPAPGAVSKTALTPGYADGSWAINKASAKQKAALELLNWMATKDFGQRFSDELAQMSPIDGVTYTNPLLKQMAENRAEHPAPYLLLTDFRWGTPLGTDVMGTQLQNVLLGKEDAAQAAAGLQEGVSTWFKPGQ